MNRWWVLFVLYPVQAYGTIGWKAMQVPKQAAKVNAVDRMVKASTGSSSTTFLPPGDAR